MTKCGAGMDVSRFCSCLVVVFIICYINLYTSKRLPLLIAVNVTLDSIINPFQSVGCDYKLESGVYMDKCRVCGGNSTTCQPMRGRIERSPTVFERLSGNLRGFVVML